MEQILSGSFETIDEKAKKAEELIETKQVDSYESAEELARLILRKERPEGKRKKDAGIEAEEIIAPLLKEIPGVQESFLSSEYDDTRNKTARFDVVLFFRGGEKVAIQMSDTHSKERQTGKINALKTWPIVNELHDDQGEIILREQMPLALVSHNLKSLFENLSKTKTSPSPETEIVKQKILRKTLEDIVYSLKFSSGLYRRNPALENFLKAKIKFFEKELEILENREQETA